MFVVLYKFVLPLKQGTLQHTAPYKPSSAQTFAKALMLDFFIYSHVYNNSAVEINANTTSSKSKNTEEKCNFIWLHKSMIGNGAFKIASL